MSLLLNKNILLGISGGIAAYKCAELVRELRRQGAHVKVILTEAAKEFITPLTLETLSGNAVYTSEWIIHPNENVMSHIELARWSDLVLIAPATANIIGSLAGGLANNLLTTTCLATQAPIFISPAMNMQMWLNPLVQSNIKRLKEHHFTIIEPVSGDQACGEIGPGRLPEPLDLTLILSQFFNSVQTANQTILITAGPTIEPIDPVRFISNHSSGKMGYTLAQAAHEKGARVILISGPTMLECPRGVKKVDVITAEEMHAAVLDHAQESQIIIGCAAVADYKPMATSTQKIKKQTQNLTISLAPNPDILFSLSQRSNPPFLVGFAAETENLIANAKKKLLAKKLDLIIANAVGKNLGFMSDYNQVTIIDREDNLIEFPLLPKLDLARKIIDLIVYKYKAIKT